MDATKARDATVERLNDAYTSLKQKSKLVDWLHNELKHRNVKEYDLLKRIPSPAQADEAKQSKQEVARLEAIVKTLRKEIQTLKENEKYYMPPRYDDTSAVCYLSLWTVTALMWNRMASTTVSAILSTCSLLQTFLQPTDLALILPPVKLAITTTR